MIENQLALTPGTALTEGSTIQQTKARYTTAITVQNPRDLTLVKKRFLNECKMAGSSFYYSWSVAGKNGKMELIEGATIGLAMALARSYGNCVVDTTEVREDDTSYTIISSFIDLETGMTISRPFRQSKKSRVGGRMDNERAADQRFQIAASKSIRNVILNALPKWLIDEGIETAKEGTRDKIKEHVLKNGIASAINHVCKALNGLGVEDSDICARMGVRETRALDLNAIVMLRGDLATIQAGEEFAENIFPTITQRKNKDRPDAEAERQKLADEFDQIANGKRDELNAFFADVKGEQANSETSDAETTHAETSETSADEPEAESDATDAEQPADAADAAPGDAAKETADAWAADERYAGLPSAFVLSIAKAKTAKTIDNRTEEFSMALTPEAEAPEEEREAADLLIAAAEDLAETAKETLAARKGN